jgi:hypothetical protein
MTTALHDKLARLKVRYDVETTLEPRHVLEVFEDIEALLFDLDTRLKQVEAELHNHPYDPPRGR